MIKDVAQLCPVIPKTGAQVIIVEILVWFHCAEHKTELKFHFQESRGASKCDTSFILRTTVQVKCRNPNECGTTPGSAVINITISPLLSPPLLLSDSRYSLNLITASQTALRLIPQREQPAPTFPPLSRIFSCSHSVIAAKINQSYNNS